MIELKPQQAGVLYPLFAQTRETMALTYLQGHMGRGWVDNREHPRCGRILVGDFCMLAGDAGAPEAAAMAATCLEGASGPLVLAVPQSQEWEALLEAAHAGRFEKLTRYAIEKEAHLDRARLKRLAENLPPGYRMERIDEVLYGRCLQTEQLGDLCCNFASAEDYCTRGIGFVAMWDGEPVGGASSYTVFDGGIEIQVDVQKAHRGQGVATACCARLILACLEQGLHPGWDAHDLRSVALAEKLGYRRGAPYTAYEIRQGRSNRE